MKEMWCKLSNEGGTKKLGDKNVDRNTQNNTFAIFGALKDLTAHENWISYYTPETKQQFSKWPNTNTHCHSFLRRKSRSFDKLQKE